MKKAFVVFCLLLILFPVFANSDLKPNDILLSDVPIYYGQEAFTNRILERTRGERDPIGLVLTGGSARAFAHIGVLQYLEEVGVEPDFIISNSMGSIIALLYSAGVSPEQILKIITVGDLSSYFNLTLPISGGLLDPSGFDGLVSSIVGKDTKLEDLPIPIMVVCEDLVTKREIRLSEGPFNKVLMASFALPVYFPPQEYRGHLLIDGGIKTLAPIELAYKYSDTVICSTTFYDVDTINLRNTISVLNSAFDINKRYNAAKDLKKFEDRLIWIRCDVEKFSFMSFDKAAELSEIGYKSARDKEAEIASLYKGGLSSNIANRRKEYVKAIEKVKNNLYYFKRIESPTPSQTLTIGLMSYQDLDGLNYLKQSFDYGLDYKIHNRKLELGTFFGFSSQTQILSDIKNSLTLGFSFNYYPISRIKFSLYGSLSSGAGEKFYIPRAYLNENFVFKFYSKDDVDISIAQTIEVSHDFSIGKNTELISSVKAIGKIGIFGSDLNISSSFFTMGYINKGSYDSYYDFNIKSRLLLPALKGLFFDLGLLSRFPIDGKNGIPLFLKDGFLTNDISYYSFVPTNSAYYMFHLPLSFGYKLSKAPTFAEFLIFQDMEAGVFCDLLFMGSAAFDYTLGLEIKLNISLIGLQDLPLTFRAGYDGVSRSPIYSIRFSI